MGRNISMRTRIRTGGESVQNRLTEENLRLHSSTYIKTDSAYGLPEEPTWASYHQFDDDFDGSDDGDMDARKHNIDLRRAASLEALKAYGGCFASGFLAMHEPLPRAPKTHNYITKLLYADVESHDLQKLASEMASIETGSATTTSINSRHHSGSPRPDSDTLSQADMEPLKNERNWRWRSTGKKRRSVEKWLKI